MSYSISVSPKYQITIPKNIRSKIAGFKPFSKVTVSFDDKTKQILITPNDGIAKTRGILGKPERNGGLSQKEFEKRKEVERIKFYTDKYGGDN